jgi:hypothetical protein
LTRISPTLFGASNELYYFCNTRQHYLGRSYRTAPADGIEKRLFIIGLAHHSPISILDWFDEIGNWSNGAAIWKSVEMSTI